MVERRIVHLGRDLERTLARVFEEGLHRRERRREVEEVLFAVSRQFSICDDAGQ